MLYVHHHHHHHTILRLLERLFEYLNLSEGKGKIYQAGGIKTGTFLIIQNGVCSMMRKIAFFE